MEDHKETSPDSSSAGFNSGDIGKKEAPNYFVRRREKFFSKATLNKAKNFLFKGWHKFVTIGVLVLIAAGVALLILFNTVWKAPEPDQSEEVTTASQLYADVQAYINGGNFEGSVEDLTAGLGVFISENLKPDGDHGAASIASIALAKIHVNNMEYTAATDVLANYLNKSSDYVGKINAADQLSSIYKTMGNYAKAIQYLELMLSYPDDVISEGMPWSESKPYVQQQIDEMRKMQEGDND